MKAIPLFSAIAFLIALSFKSVEAGHSTRIEYRRATAACIAMIIAYTTFLSPQDRRPTPLPDPFPPSPPTAHRAQDLFFPPGWAELAVEPKGSKI